MLSDAHPSELQSTVERLIETLSEYPKHFIVKFANVDDHTFLIPNDPDLYLAVSSEEEQVGFSQLDNPAFSPPQCREQVTIFLKPTNFRIPPIPNPQPAPPAEHPEVVAAREALAEAEAKYKLALDLPINSKNRVSVGTKRYHAENRVIGAKHQLQQTIERHSPTPNSDPIDPSSSDPDLDYAPKPENPS